MQCRHRGLIWLFTAASRITYSFLNSVICSSISLPRFLPFVGLVSYEMPNLFTWPSSINLCVMRKHWSWSALSCYSIDSVTPRLLNSYDQSDVLLIRPSVISPIGWQVICDADDQRPIRIMKHSWSTRRFLNLVVNAWLSCWIRCGYTPRLRVGSELAFVSLNFVCI